MLQQDAQSAENRFARIAQLTKTITIVPFAFLGPPRTPLKQRLDISQFDT